MEIKRFFAEKGCKKDGCFIIGGEEAQHIIRVLRYKVGYKLTVFDGSGYDYACTIRDITRETVCATIDSVGKNENEPKIYLHLYQGVAKQDKLDTVVQKAVELGVSEFTPVYTARSEQTAPKADKLEKIALSAAKQCGAAKLMKINSPVYLSEIKSDNLFIMAYEDEKERSLRDVALGKFTRIDLLVGSEGGFTEEEAEAMKANGALLVSLGKRILRTETASIVLSALILYKAGNL